MPAKKKVQAAAKSHSPIANPPAWKNFFFPLLIFAAALCIAFFPMVFLGKTIFFADNFSLFVPQRLFLINEIKKGELPLWNPYILNGVPYFANISKAVLYPATYLFFFFQPGVAVTVLVLGHLLISALGIYWTARLFKYQKWQAILSGLLWIFSVHLVAGMNNLVVIQTLAWIPWVFGLSYAVFILRRQRLLPILILATILNILGGHTQPLIYSGLLAVLVALVGMKRNWRVNFPLFLIWGILSFSISAVILIPLQDYAAQTTRMNTTTTEALSGSLNPLQLIKFFLPYFWSNPSKGVAWGPDWGIMRENGGYVTVVGLLSMFITAPTLWKKRLLYRFLLLLSFGSLLLSTGRYFWPILFFYEHFPQIHFLRSPSAILTIWVLSTAFLVTASLQYLKIKKSHLFVSCAVGAALLFGIAYVELRFTQLWQNADRLSHFKLSTSSFHTFDKDYAIFRMIAENVVITGLITLAVLYLLSRPEPIKNWTRWAVVILLGLEMIYAHHGIVFYAPNSIYTPSSEAASALQKYITPQDRFATSVGMYGWTGLPSYWENINFRPPFQASYFTTEEQQDFAQLRGRRDLLTTNWGMPYELPTSYGYSTFIMKRTADAFKIGLSGSNINELDAKNFQVPQVSQFSNKYLLMAKTIAAPAFLEKEMSSFTLLEDHPDWALYENKNALPIIRSTDPAGHPVEVSSIKRTANTLGFTANASSDASLFIAETYEKGWKAWVDQKPVTIHESNSARLIDIPAGQHQIEMKYQPESIKRGAFLSLVGLFGLILLIVIQKYQPSLISVPKLHTITQKHAK
jgi:hypothetical protein